MKTVYFVRHGESEANAGFATFQGEASQLTEKGRQQAQFIAERCKNLSFDVLLASPAVRCQETANFISQKTGKSIETVELFVERKMPTELLGKRRDDPEADQMELDWLLTFYVSGKKVGSGENFDELKVRALKALEYLKGRKENSILVSTHGFFLRMLSAVIVMGNLLDAEEFRRFAKAFRTQNTGLSIVEWRDEVDYRLDRMPFQGWRINVWNDHAHLG